MAGQLNVASRGPEMVVVVNFIVGLFMLPYLFLYLYLGLYVSAASAALQLFVCAPCIFWLVKKQHLDSARVFLCASTSLFALFGVSLGVDHQMNVEYYFVPVGIMPFIICDLSRRVQICCCVLFPALAWLLISSFQGHFLPSGFLAVERYMSTLSAINLWGAYIATLVFFGMFYSSSIHFEAVTIQQNKMASLGQMAGGMAHEINNPLNLILMQTYTLRNLVKGQAAEHQQIHKSIDSIEGTVDRIAKIIRGLLAFSRSSDNDPFQSTTLASIVHDTLELCQEKLKKEKVDLQVHGRLNIHLDCRPAQISQVLLNLIINASDAIRGLPEQWIRVEVFGKENHVAVHVVDSGRGISPEIAQRIMEPFFTTKPVGAGTGLGLSLAKGLVESHGGNLTLDPDAPHTCFVVELPLRHAQEMPTKKAA